VEKVYNILRDNLGSITHIIAPDDSLVQELSYDAWGRLRDPATLQVFEPGNEPELFFGRGYTGHEHLTRFGLINMNARLYDVALGRFLSPDPYVQMPDFSQNFNRYSYCMNNPLKYVDKDGKLFWLIAAAAVVGAYIGGVASNKGNLNPFTWNWKQPTTYLGLGVGAILGYSCAYGLLNPGTLGYTFGVNNSIVGVGLTVGGAGSLNNWNFNWSTKAGGGGNFSLNINSSESKESDSRFFHGTQYEASKWLVYTSKNNNVEMAMYKTDYGYYFEQAEGYVFSSQEFNRERFTFAGMRQDGQYIYYAHNALDAGTLYSIRQRRDGKPYLDFGLGQQFDVREMYHTHPRSTPLSPDDPLKGTIPTYAIGWDGIRRGDPVVVNGAILLEDVPVFGTRIK
jgi:RHS repeat-associated protein